MHNQETECYQPSLSMEPITSLPTIELEKCLMSTRIFNMMTNWKVTGTSSTLGTRDSLQTQKLSVMFTLEI